ncbi:MAG: hypothetical protein KDE26_08090 [Bacteroidetes bacterium]|nr:hypothetical protein [Bacteroidota bacterium]
MPNPEELKGGKLYLEHLEEMQHQESLKKEAMELAERLGNDVEQVRRSHDVIIESFKKDQEKDRQQMGKDPLKEAGQKVIDLESEHSEIGNEIQTLEKEIEKAKENGEREEKLEDLSKQMEERSKALENKEKEILTAKREKAILTAEKIKQKQRDRGGRD